MRILQFICYGICCLFLLAACQRELNFDADPQQLTAQYSFMTAGDSCSNPVVRGVYRQGEVLADSNGVILQVNVTRTGAYLISTSILNGVYFRDSGSFNSTGLQTVTLRGLGTPASAGRFTYLGAGCGFSISFFQNPANNPALFSLGGSPGNCSGFSITGDYTAGVALDSALQGIQLQVTVQRAGNYQLSTNEVNGIRFSAAGVFSATGLQSVRLAGFGTPVTAGNFNYRAGSNPGSCGFSIHVRVPGPSASGNFSCGEAAVSGNFRKGSSVSGAGYIILPVFVTSAGNYSISTPYINGCVFSAEGYLPTGDQVIMLTGNGIPPDSGIFHFPVLLGDDSCSVPVPFGDGPFSDYLVCNINGIEHRFNADLTADDANIFQGLNSISIVGRPVPGAAEYFSLTINSVQPVGPGSYTQGAAGRFSGSFHKDTGNVFWQPSDLSDPRFSVMVNSVSAGRVEGTFSGQYFDLNGLGSNTRQVTEGRFSVRIQ